MFLSLTYCSCDHFIAQMLVDLIKAQTLTWLVQTSAGMVTHAEGSGGTVRDSDALSSRALADPLDPLVVADPAPHTPVATQPAALAPPAGHCSLGDSILDYFQLLQVLRVAGEAMGMSCQCAGWCCAGGCGCHHARSACPQRRDGRFVAQPYASDSALVRHLRWAWLHLHTSSGGRG